MFTARYGLGLSIIHVNSKLQKNVPWLSRFSTHSPYQYHFVCCRGLATVYHNLTPRFTVSLHNVMPHWWYTLKLYSFHGVIAPSGPGLPHYRGFTITFGGATIGRTPLDEWSARRRNLYLTTHNTLNSTHVSGRIRARNPSQRAASDRRLSTSGCKKYWSK